MDFPNLYRRVQGSTEKYSALWGKNVRDAREAGIEVGVIALPNADTIEAGAEALYTHFVDELGIGDFQVNLPFPGGTDEGSDSAFAMSPEVLGEFMVDLAGCWIEHGLERGVRIGPFDALLEHFTHGEATLPCIWQDNCAHHLVSIDAKGNVSQCDCWVTSYPEYSFGNIFKEDSFSDLLAKSLARQDFVKRTGHLMQHSDCLECNYLALCHGGCPVRTYSIRKTLFEKDPYCHTYLRMFSAMEDHAANLAGQRIRERTAPAFNFNVPAT
jgi:radical SAM protein with 4Fe4S-binding SPASM domain